MKMQECFFFMPNFLCIIALHLHILILKSVNLSWMANVWILLLRITATILRCLKVNWQLLWSASSNSVSVAWMACYLLLLWLLWLLLLDDVIGDGLDKEVNLDSLEISSAMFFGTSCVFFPLVWRCIFFAIIYLLFLLVLYLSKASMPTRPWMFGDGCTNHVQNSYMQAKKTNVDVSSLLFPFYYRWELV